MQIKDVRKENVLTENIMIKTVNVRTVGYNFAKSVIIASILAMNAIKDIIIMKEKIAEENAIS